MRLVPMTITTVLAHKGEKDLHATCVVLFLLCVGNRRCRTMYSDTSANEDSSLRDRIR